MHLDRKNLKVTRVLQKELLGCSTVLDLGCGQSSLLQYVKGLKKTLGVDCWLPYIEESTGQGIHTEYMRADIMNCIFPPRSFDAVVLIDVLEHIEKGEALKLIYRMQYWAKKKVIVVVPNGFMPQEDPYGNGNKNQDHISAWTVKELESIGFKILGIGGLKHLRGKGAEIIPTQTTVGHYILAGISKLSEPFTEVFPKHAFHLFAVFNKDEL